MEAEEKKEESIVETHNKSKKNPWAVSTGVLIVISAVLIAIIFGLGNLTGNVISEKDAGTKLVDFLNGRVGGGVVYDSAEDLGSIYKVNVAYQGEQIPVYVTKDGNYFINNGVTPLTGEAVQEQVQQAPKEVPKSDKPKVEAFVFSYCPYGTQFEKALIPVYKILKSKADINIVAIGAMHGEYEKQESLRQLCIQKVYGKDGKDKLFNYLEKFLGETAIGNCRGDTSCSDPLVEKVYIQAGIDKTTINNCIQKDAAALYSADTARAGSLGVSGSPTFVVNGVQVSVDRSPDAIMKAICSGFTTAPAECSQAVSTQAAQPGFGYTENPSVSNTHASGSC